MLLRYIFTIYFVGCLCFNNESYAQANNWITKFSKDERVEVKYMIENKKNEAGEKVQEVEYELLLH